MPRARWAHAWAASEDYYILKLQVFQCLWELGPEMRHGLTGAILAYSFSRHVFMSGPPCREGTPSSSSWTVLTTTGTLHTRQITLPSGEGIKVSWNIVSIESGAWHRRENRKHRSSSLGTCTPRAYTMSTEGCNGYWDRFSNTRQTKTKSTHTS